MAKGLPPWASHLEAYSCLSVELFFFYKNIVD